MPTLENLPDNWPGTDLEQGLRDEHIAPNCRFLFTLICLFELTLFYTVIKHCKASNLEDDGREKGIS